VFRNLSRRDGQALTRTGADLAWPLVSIVTPSYNQSEFLEATIRSVLEQDYPNIEYIICDGGSTDGSVNLIHKYADRLAWWCSERDGGQSDAINKGLARARGSIIGWLNSDDTLLPGCVSTVVRAFGENPNAGLVFGGLEIIDEAGDVTGLFGRRPYTFADQLTHRMIIPQPSSFWRSSVARAVGPVRSDLHFTMDFEYWIRIGRRFSIVQIPETLAQFRVSSVNKGAVQRGGWGPEFIRVLDDLYSEPDLPDFVRTLRSRAYAGAFTHGAAWFVASGEYAEARKWIWKAVSARAAVIMRPRWWHTATTAVLGSHVHAAGRRAKLILRGGGRHTTAG